MTRKIILALLASVLLFTSTAHAYVVIRTQGGSTLRWPQTSIEWTMTARACPG